MDVLVAAVAVARAPVGGQDVPTNRPVAPAEVEGAFTEGLGFDGSAIEGFSRVSEADTVAKPDPTTFQILPWTTSKGEQHSARMFCDIVMPDGTPSWADSRHVLRRQLNKAADQGFSCYVHPEIEFFLLKNLPTDGSEPTPADSGGYFDQAVHDAAPNFRRHAIEALGGSGFSGLVHQSCCSGTGVLLAGSAMVSILRWSRLRLGP